MSLADGAVLLVEDDADDVFAFQWALRKAGLSHHPIQVATDGKKAMAYLSGGDQFSDRATFPLPSLIFLDLKLPYINGMEILGWIREQPHLAGIRVVILSGSDERRDHDKARLLGVETYLVKPASPEDLREILCRDSVSRSSV